MMLFTMKNDTATEFVNKFLTTYCLTYIGKPDLLLQGEDV